MTTYPYGTWAAGWGTSFSAPLVSGTAALMVSTSPTKLNPEVAVDRVAEPRPRRELLCRTPSRSQIVQMGYGRLDTYQAMQAWRKAMGLK